MLVIRKEQMDAFSRDSRVRFEDGLVAYFTATYPRETRQAGGEKQIRRLVQSGIERAFTLGFQTERQVTLFVALQFMLGCDFDSDPQLPWASEIANRTLRNPTLRIDFVYDAAIDYLTATAGEDCEHVVRALLRIRAYDFASAPQSSGEQFVTDVLGILHGFCPAKFEHQGEEANRQLVSIGRQTALRYGITENRGVLLLITLMFMLGSGIDRDLLHPWAASALTDPRVPDEAGRIDRLYREAMAHTELSLQAD